MAELSEGSRAGLRERAARYVPVLLLIAVALSQLYLAAVGELLTPAKGGGFGLFSTVDKLKNRSLRIYLVDEAGEERAFRSPGFGRQGRRLVEIAQALPSRRHLRAVAREVAALAEEPSLAAVRVEVWKKGFDSARVRARRTEVAELTLSVDARSP